VSTPALLPEAARADIQGLVTTGYGHLPWAAYLFLEVRNAPGARRWLGDRLPHVSTAAPWPRGSDGTTMKPSRALNVAFTAPGLAALGLPPAVLCTFPPEFQEGMAHPERARTLGDEEESAPEAWELGGPGHPPIHAVLLLHAATRGALRTFVEEERRVLEATGGAVALVPHGEQEGTVPEGHLEPFGFRDGMAQPRVEGIHGHGVPTGEFILGYPNHYGIVPPGPVVPGTLDPGGLLPPLVNPHRAGEELRDLGLHGTYLVYRKLEQDVARFWRFLAAEAERRGRPQDAAYTVRLGALCVGRWPGGAPLALSPDQDDPTLAETDDFLYGDDPEGRRCPLGAHVRRTNPRDVIHPYGPETSLRMSRAHRILRRGRIYGEPLFDLRRLQAPGASLGRELAELRDDGKPRGLHFLSVNAGIAGQFEFIQQAWCNNPRFNGLHDNPDPLIGRVQGPEPVADSGPAQGSGPIEGSGHMEAPHSRGGHQPGDGALPPPASGRRPGVMTFPRGVFHERTAPLPRFVTVRGGAYLFLPGMRGLRFLAEGEGLGEGN
jgi:deferrochelatase/peroxidase EfeB